jgi:hypothetical protein
MKVIQNKISLTSSLSYGGGEIQFIRLLNLSTKCREMVSFTLPPLYIPERIWICGCIRTRTVRHSGMSGICISVINSIFFAFPCVLISSGPCFTKDHELRRTIPVYYKSKEYERKYDRKTGKIGYPWSTLKMKERGGKMAGWW